MIQKGTHLEVSYVRPNPMVYSILLSVHDKGVEKMLKADRGLEICKKAVQSVSGLKFEVIKSKSRVQHIVKTRILLCVLLREYTTFTLERIAYTVGLNTHGTVQKNMSSFLFQKDTEPYLNDMYTKAKTKVEFLIQATTENDYHFKTIPDTIADWGLVSYKYQPPQG